MYKHILIIFARSIFVSFPEAGHNDETYVMVVALVLLDLQSARNLLCLYLPSHISGIGIKLPQHTRIESVCPVCSCLERQGSYQTCLSRIVHCTRIHTIGRSLIHKFILTFSTVKPLLYQMILSTGREKKE